MRAEFEEQFLLYWQLGFFRTWFLQEEKVLMRVVQPMTKSGWPYSTGWPFSTSTCLTTPALSDSISLSSFMASIMQSVCPSLISCPISTKGVAPGEDAL